MLMSLAVPVGMALSRIGGTTLAAVSVVAGALVWVGMIVRDVFLMPWKKIPQGKSSERSYQQTTFLTFGKWLS
jgi:hypothetical protein